MAQMNTSHLEFNTRESYLEFRANWKARYKKISEMIRSARTAFKTAQREFSRVDPKNSSDYSVYTRLSSAEKTARHNGWKALEAARKEYFDLRSAANGMLADLSIAVELSRKARAVRLAGQPESRVV